MELWRIHRWVGWLSLLAFAATGIYLLLEMTSMIEQGGQAMRIAYRANHIYLLAAGLVNLTLATGLRHAPVSTRPRMAYVASGLLIISPESLLVGYVLGPTEGGDPAVLVSLGVTTMAAGVFLHLAASKPPKRPS